MSQKRIGVLPFGDKNWIAGVTYLQNILRSLRTLPEDERPQIFLLCDFDAPVDQICKDYELERSQILIYSYQDPEIPKYKLIAILRSLKRFIWPKSLKQTLRENHIDIVAPTLKPLGADFPLPWIGWIPDLQHKHFPNFFSKDELEGREQAYQQLVKDSSFVIVSNQHSMDGLKKWFEVDETKSGVLRYPAVPCDSWYTGSPEEYKQEHHLPEKYLMYPCQFWKHKNHATLFEAIRILVQEKSLKDIVLVCSGNQHDYRHPNHFAELEKFIQDHNLQEHIRCLGFLPREDQIQLVRGACAIVQASLFEGWCIMIEEMQTLGKTIFCSDIEMHREQNPRKTTFFNPHHPQDLADCIAQHWGDLHPGPNHEEEHKAKEIIHQRSIEFARTFIGFVDKALTLHTKRTTS